MKNNDENDIKIYYSLSYGRSYMEEDKINIWFSSNIFGTLGIHRLEILQVEAIEFKILYKSSNIVLIFIFCILYIFMLGVFIQMESLFWIFIYLKRVIFRDGTT